VSDDPTRSQDGRVDDQDVELAFDETALSDPHGSDWPTRLLHDTAVTDLTPPAQPRRGLRPGELVAEHIEIVRPLGAGGMGEVFVARDRKLGRRVALKTLKLPAGLSRAERERFDQLFERDAASTAQLNHPNIVTVFQFGEHGDTPFFVLELVDGDPLDELLSREGPLTEREVLELGVQLCDALGYAHAQGVIHRDIKPANLMRTKDGRLKVLDFGIALMRKARADLEDAFGESLLRVEERLGAEPVSAGTPAYMAPEQLLGMPQDARVDVWAAGVTLFELLTGQRPYDSPLATGPDYEPPWPDACDVSQGARAAVLGCLSRDLDARTASMDVLRRALRELPEAMTSLTPSRPAAPRTNLVVPQDAFVGRQETLDALHAQVLEGGHGVVTLVGPGGVGKTRVITEFGLRALDEDGVTSVLLCSLAEARTKDAVLFALSDVLGVPLTSEDPEQKLVWVLQGRSGLVLILDNCEQVADHVAELLSDWAPKVTGVRLVSTSRVPLDIAAERVVDIGPLLDPGLAVALYTARAQQVRTGWVCPPEQEGALEQLVEQLDRLPLAIELAAARSKILPPKKMLERISHRFKILRSSQRGVSDRQATLEGTIAWSWDLLGAEQRDAMAQLSVFEGSFALEAAEEVCVLSDGFVFDVVEQLVSASLLRDVDDGERFRMLVSVRAFALARLSASGQEDDVRARHASWLAERWGSSQVDRARAIGMQALSEDVDDLEAASAWALEVGRSPEVVEAGLICTSALTAAVIFRGPLGRSDELARRVTRHEQSASSALSEALGNLGRLSKLRGDVEDARARLERALECAVEAGDRKAEGVWLLNLGIIEQNRGALVEARAFYERAMEASREVGDRMHEGRALGNLGVLERLKGNHSAAVELFERALRVAIEAGDRSSEGSTMGNLGVIARRSGDLERARELYARATEVAEELGDRRLVSVWQGNLGPLERDNGSMERARGLRERALASAVETGARRFECTWLMNLGGLERDVGRLDVAEHVLSARGSSPSSSRTGAARGERSHSWESRR